MAGDAATSAADKVNPNEDQLKQIDLAADENTWHDVSDMSAGNIKGQIKSTYSKQKPVNKEDLHETAGNAIQTANPDGSRDPADAAQRAGHDQAYGTNSGVDAHQGAQEGANTLKQRMSENLPDETKEEARKRGQQTKQATKDYLSKKMPQERREQTIWRLKKMVVECQGHPDYNQAITTLLNLAEQYAGHANTVGQQSTGTVKGAHADSSLKKAEADLRLLIERFANGTSMNDLLDSVNLIYKDADKDPELKSWFKQIDAYIRKCLKQQGFIMEDQATEEWNKLYDQGQFLLRDRYRNHTDRIVDEVKFLADQFDTDPQNKRFAESMQKLFNDLGNDENGKPTFKPHLVKDLSDVILPAIFESIQYVPIPRIEYSDPQFDAVIENLVVESDNLMPNIFELANDNYFRWGRKKISNNNHNSIMLSVSGIQMDLRDVSYYVKRKQGTLKVSDLGVADIYLGGQGFSFKVKLSTADDKDRQNFFKVDKVDVEVKNFDIKLKQSKHKLLFGLFKPLMLKVMRPALQKAFEKIIKDKVHELDSMAYQVKLEADRAAKEVKENPENAPNIYQRYVSAVQKKILQGQKKAEDVKKNTTVNMAMTQNDSIFPDLKLPGGISSKATEYKDLALKGNSWETPVFALGSAKASTDIPKAVDPTRKSHRVTQGGVRGPSMTNQLHDPSAYAGGMSGAGTSNTLSADSTAGNQNSAITGFGSQVDQAFGQNSTVTPVSTTGASTSATNGQALNGAITGTTTNGAVNGKFNTQFGADNPVMTGRV
ncbi:hypothetical protein BJ875DRAFT_477613 [Amylocarpus encephaloides]|uniref:Uncharacterized protein n=1 Tax=Amylocarpus encephaloides TaxID=45428 RepID=A0A9P7Y7P5_9HELO|nr:hypothetical protein BJ875DRAFT_477613 [Amylocarpus encephaloides]